MKLRTLITVGAILSLFVSVAPVFAALPTVNTFTVPATAVSPVPVTAFTATDSDGTVVGYMITQTSTKPAASDSRWTPTPWSSFTTTSIGALTLYAWAKDNANGVSNSRTAATNVVGTHEHSLVQVTGLTAALAGKADIGHNHDAVYQKKYANVVVVAKSGGDFTDPVAALDSITNASSENSYLVKIMPGFYNIGTGSVRMKEYVDIEGSGEKVTSIFGFVQTNLSDPTAAVVIGANNAELRLVTISGSGSPQIAILNVGTSPTFSSVTVNALAGGTDAAVGVFNTRSAAPVMRNMTINALYGGGGTGVSNNDSSAPVITNSTISGGLGIFESSSASVLKDLTITSTYYGVFMQSSATRLDGVVIDAATGVEVRDSSPKLTRVEIHATTAIEILGTIQSLLIDQCILEGSEFSLSYVIGFGGSLRVGASKLVGPRSFGSLAVVCVGAYDGNYTALGTACE